MPSEGESQLSAVILLGDSGPGPASSKEGH